MVSRDFDSIERETIRRTLALLGICHCGPGSRVYYGALREILRRAGNGLSMYDSGRPFDVLAVKLVGAARNNLIEHWDTDIRCGLLPAGAILLEFLETFDTDIDDWPRWTE